jgi:hypothetical protein
MFTLKGGFMVISIMWVFYYTLSETDDGFRCSEHRYGTRRTSATGQYSVEIGSQAAMQRFDARLAHGLPDWGDESAAHRFFNQVALEAVGHKC